MANHYTRQIPDLSEAQRQQLQRWVRRSKTAQALVLRARIVLETAAGKSDLVVAGELGTTRGTDRERRARLATMTWSGWWCKPWRRFRQMLRIGARARWPRRVG